MFYSKFYFLYRIKPSVCQVERPHSHQMILVSNVENFQKIRSHRKWKYFTKYCSLITSTGRYPSIYSSTNPKMYIHRTHQMYLYIKKKQQSHILTYFIHRHTLYTLHPTDHFKNAAIRKCVTKSNKYKHLTLTAQFNPRSLKDCLNR